MIYGLLTNWQRDKRFFPAVFDTAFAFLAGNDVSALANGKHPIDGERMFASMQRPRTQNEQFCRFEAHQRYCDIQFLLTGREKQRYAPNCSGMTLTEDLLRVRDLAFYTPPPWYSSLILGPSHYAVYFPGEPHSPCCAAAGDGEDIHKIVVKILWPT